MFDYCLVVKGFEGANATAVKDSTIRWCISFGQYYKHKKHVTPITLPNILTVSALRDSLVGNVLFLSVVPILPPAVGFPALPTTFPAPH